MTQTLGAASPASKDLWKKRGMLRGFLLANFTTNVALVEDLVMQTLLNAIRNLDSFEAGSNLDAWLVTICRNLYLSHYRKKRREVEDPDEIFASRLTFAEEQEWHLVGQDIRTAVGKLPIAQREVVTLILLQGKNYEEVAEIQGIPIGTVKSRLNRGRLLLMHLLSEEVPGPPQPKRDTRAKLTMLSWRWQNRQKWLKNRPPKPEAQAAE